MDDHKWRAFRHVLLRTKPKLDLKHHFAAVRELEERARACYEEPISLGSNEFILMMLLDGCFVLELLQGVTENNGFIELGYSPNDPVFANRGPIVHLQQDMLMLENQLPLFVLERLLELQLGSAYKKGDAALLIAKFFCPLTLTPAEESWPIEELLSITDSLHCLDVFRENILKKSWIEKDEDERRSLLSECPAQKQHLIHCVAKLEEVGIKFKKRETSRFWDIKFNRGVLEIPRLCIRYGTKSLLLNLIAFEQCHPECINNITSYVFFMGNLINSKKDVAYLHSRGIIEHWLGSDAEVVELFKCLSKEVVFYRSCSCLCKLSRDMNCYFGLKCKTWCASLQHKYLWAIFLLGVLTAYYFCIRSMKHMAIRSQGESG